MNNRKMTIYEKKEKLCKEYKLLQKEYLGCDNWSRFWVLKDKEDKAYKKFLFFKNYLNAERKLK